MVYLWRGRLYSSAQLQATDDHQSSPLCSCSVTQTVIRLCGRMLIAICRAGAGSLAKRTTVEDADSEFGTQYN
jgi:hypothetical protein